MRIGFDAKRAFLNTTGLGNYSRDTIRILSNYYQHNKYFLYTPEKKKDIHLPFLDNRENTLIRTPQSLINKTLKAYWRSKNIVHDLFKNKIDIYHGLSNELPRSIEKTSIKTVVTIHDLIFIRYPNLFNAIDRKIYYRKFKSACNRADKIIAVSKQTKQDIVKFFLIPQEKVEVVYQGCNKVFQNVITKDKKKAILTKYNLPENYLLYVGRIEARKNLLTLLKVLKELPKQRLIIIGNGKAYKEKCMRFIVKHNLSDRAIFLNDLILEEMAAIYQSAQLLVYPSIFEGFGIPILEALSSKIPVITSKNGCFAEAGGPATKYINPLSVNEMKAAIIEIQNSTELQEKMIIEGLKYAQNFKDEKIAKNLMAVYKTL